jgi:F0F1-type ATP synthase assembly protein I
MVTTTVVFPVARAVTTPAVVAAAYALPPPARTASRMRTAMRAIPPLCKIAAPLVGLSITVLTSFPDVFVRFLFTFLLIIHLPITGPCDR